MDNSTRLLIDTARAYRDSVLIDKETLKRDDKILIDLLDYFDENGYLSSNQTALLRRVMKNKKLPVPDVNSVVLVDVDKLVEKAGYKDINPDDLEIPGLKGTLMPFQKEGVAFIESRHGRALLADDMGLGKTIQAIAYTQLHKDEYPVVIISPSAMKYKWAEEFATWTDATIFVLFGSPSKQSTPFDDIYLYREAGEPVVVILNYDIIAPRTTKKGKGKKAKKVIKSFGWKDILKLTKPKMVILDEAHYIKNPTAARTVAIKSLATGVPKILALTGTPILSRPMEIYTVVKLIQPDLFGSKRDFGLRYCNGQFNGYGWDFSGASNTDELNEILTKTIMIRRTKDQVLDQLPDKIRSVIPIHLPEKAQQEYYRAEEEFVLWLAERDYKKAMKAKKAQRMVKVGELRRFVAEAKLDQTFSWIDDFLESDRKLVVFAHHRKILKAIHERYKRKSVLLIGGMTGKQAQEAVQKFQEDDKIKLFVGSIRAAGVGITLTSASDVLFVELPWTPADLEQAEDRVHRIGQKGSVTIYYLIAKNTLEENIAKLLQKKKKIFSQVVDGKFSSVQDFILDAVVTDLVNKHVNQGH